MKFNWKYLLGASVITGAISALFYRQSAKKSVNSRKQLINQYVGKWWFINKSKKVQHSLSIDSNLNITINNQIIDYQLIELSIDRLVIQDKHGYHLIIQSSKLIPQTLYDEADNITYLLEIK